MCMFRPCGRVLKCPCAKKSLSQNINGDKMSVCQYVHRVETWKCQNVSVMKCLCRNVFCRNVGYQNGGKSQVSGPQIFSMTPYVNPNFHEGGGALRCFDHGISKVTLTSSKFSTELCLVRALDER